MYVYTAKGKGLRRNNNLFLIYLKHDQQCLTHHLATQELIISGQVPSKKENGSEEEQKQTKDEVSFLMYGAVHSELAEGLSTDCFIMAL